jgi:glutamate dehydrogenase
VYSPRVEGIHLRFAPIARGGIRWSDRAQDFRTEVLGLVRAQLVKNSVIVPSGAKGGFLPKQLPRNAGRDELQNGGHCRLSIFISALLDITDNLKDRRRAARHCAPRCDRSLSGGRRRQGHRHLLRHRQRACRRARLLARRRLRLGRLGATTTRPWRSPRAAPGMRSKRHFREMDIDIARQPFRWWASATCRATCSATACCARRRSGWSAAFDHRDIFIDPDPDAASSFAERKRLFDLPRSSWQDYDRSKISKGGGVFARSAKAIAVSPEMAALLGINSASLTPNELMHALLKCKTDLLWFGGIGTYVRASSESDADAGDRANDAIRSAPPELGAKVVGEGANLA